MWPNRRGQKGPQGAPLWVVTFSDLMSLLLAFFILLVSFTRLDARKFEQFSGSVTEAFGAPTAASPPSTDAERTEPALPATTFSAAQTAQSLVAVIERQRQRAPAEAAVLETFVDARGVVLRVGEEAMFDEGRAEVRPSMWPLLDDVATLAVEQRARVQVEAHTDARPIRTPEFPSNDHLAGARALAVIAYMVGAAPELAGSALDAVPLGDTRPIAAETGESGRRRNRRVELVFQEALATDRPGQSPPP
jgi:chemotaxis protein MotB